MIRRLRPDRGFTLVELLVAITALGIIMVPLAGAMSVSYRAVKDTTNRVAGSTDAQILSLYLPNDAQSSNAAIADASGASIVCTGDNNPRLKLSYTNSVGTVTRVVIYGINTVGSTNQLERYDCTTGTVTKTTVVARNLASTSAVTPACITSCALGSYKGASLTVTENKVLSTDTAYTFTVIGRKRY